MRKAAICLLMLAWLIELVSAQQTSDRNRSPYSSTQNAGMTERAVAVESGKIERIGVYVNIRPDCTTGPPPVVRIAEPPRVGQVSMELVNLQLTNVGACSRSEGPGFIASYETKPGFEGDDRVVIEVRFPDRGNTSRLETITIKVRVSGTKL
jgi:hypothetical protein